MASSFDPPQETASRQRDRVAAALLGVACLLALLRLLRLGDWSLWYDEALTLGDAWHGSGWMPGGGPVHALGYGLIRAVASCFGGRPDEFALRIGPAVAGMLCVPLTAWAFRPLAGRRAASFAALLVAVSSWHLYWSQNARAYTFAQAQTLLATGVWARGWVRSDRWRCALGVGLALAASAFHPHAAGIAAGLGLAPFFGGRGEVPQGGAGACAAERRRAERAGFLVLLLGGLLSLPVLAPALLDYVGKKDTEVGFVAEAISGFVHLVTSTGFQLTPVLGVAALAGAWLGWRSRPGRVVVMGTLLPVLGMLAVSLWTKVSAQYLFCSLPWAAALAAWPLGTAFLRRGRSAWVYGGLLVLPALASCALYFGWRHGERPRWREAYSYVWSARGEHDLVLGMQAGLGEYYVDPTFTDVRHPRLVGWCDYKQPHNVLAAAQTDRPLWIVVRPEFLELWDPKQRATLEALLQDQCHLKRRFPVPMEGRDLTVLVYHRPGRPVPGS